MLKSTVKIVPQNRTNNAAEALPITSQPIMPEPDSYRVFGFSPGEKTRSTKRCDEDRLSM